MKTNIRNLKSDKGFTIIEILIVLAIAGLILAIVFLAVPQLQRSARDNQRQNALARVKSELESFAANNQGIYPFQVAPSVKTLANFSTNYLSADKLTNPKTGATYTVTAAGGSTLPANNPSANQILVYPGMACDGEALDATTTFAAPSATLVTKQYAIRVQLDRATTFYCLDNG